MRIIFVALVTAALGATACASSHKPKERAITGDIVVANSMCGAPGVAAATNDKPGDRMICAFEEPVGSHVPQCVCHDEKRLAEDRETGQAFLRDAEHGRCLSNGTGTCK
jgi:hypothetical protein